MGQRVSHLPRRRKHKKTDRLTKTERRACVLQRQEQWIAQWIALAKAFIEMLLNSEMQELLGREPHQWGDRRAPVEVNACCDRCQRKYRGWFRRNGTYSRSLVTDGVVIEFCVPRLRCACGGTVDVSFSVFAPYQRVSPEATMRLLEAVALGLTLRQVGAVTAPANGAPLAKSTINGRVLEVSRLVEAFHKGALERIPPVVLVDGLWVKVMEPTGERFVDGKGRNQPRVKRKKVGLLVAYGVDPATGDWWVLDWERAEQEDEASWERLLERLRQRGLTAEKGLRLIVSDGSEGLAAALGLVDLGPGVRHQRCVFHKLRNVAKAVKASLAASKEDKQKQREQVVKEAASIYEGQDRAEILRRRDQFVAKWQETEPEAVATLLRDFEKTIEYLEVLAAARARGEAWEVRYLRTTSALERLNRTLRRMVRQVVLFHCDAGLEVRVYLILMQAGEMLIPQGDDWLEVLGSELAAT
ncbi:MAG: transposase [Dehalococcoidia bacterium]|nr:transposase [Dehalococcoidia bacterium]